MQEGVFIRVAIAAIMVCLGVCRVAAGTIHQEYDGPWHWDELTRHTESLDGSSAIVNGVQYPILNGTKYTGTAEITGSKTESAHLTIPSRISYSHWVRGPWGENGDETLLSYQTHDFEVVSITAGTVATGFQLETWLKSIIIPTSVTNIGHGAFYGCSNLTNVNLSARIERIQDSTFLGTGIKSIGIPNSVHAIDYAAFNSCSNLVEISIPASVKEIGEFAFGACYSLTNAILSGVTNISRGAFWKCYDLKSVSLPQSLISIDDHAFGACQSLESIVIPDSVEYVHDNAFLGCTSLDRIVIGKRVNSYGFIGSGNTLEIHSSSVVKMIANSDRTFDSVTNIVLGAEISEVPDAFYTHFPFYNRESEGGQTTGPNVSCIVHDGSLVSVQGVGLTTFEIPDFVSRIKETAFEGCLSLREIIIPDTVTHIDANAFHNCTNLERIVIGSGVISAGTPLFSWEDEEGCHYGSFSLQEVEVGNATGLAVFRNGRFPNVAKVEFGWRFIELPYDYLECFPNATVATVREALPDLSGASDEEATMILSHAADGGLTNVTNVATYNALRSWAIDNCQHEVSHNAAMARVLTSQFAWSAFALDAPELLTRENPIQNDDIKIASFMSNAGQGTFSMEVSIDDLLIGDAADPARLAKVFGIEGATSLTEDSFASENVTVELTEPMNGKVHIIAKPKMNSGDSTFFMRVSVSQQ